jgi:hypothetical protein
MVSPLRSPLSARADADPPTASQPSNCNKYAGAETPDETARDDDLRRLEQSVEWLVRESTMAVAETGLRAQRKLPRAHGLPPASYNTEGWRQRRVTLQLTAPLASERLQLSADPGGLAPHVRRAALCILIACVIGGMLAYHVSIGSSLSASGPAQVATAQAR